MEQDEQAPFPREPWQQLLEGRGEMPPQTTDARIRAAARQALAPRSARWWLPASLAASVLLAVMIVQWQYGERESPAVVTEADVAEPAAPADPVPDYSTMDPSPPTATRRRASEPAGQAPPPRDDPPGYVQEPEAAGSDEAVTVNGARIGGPERDLRESSEMSVDDAREEAAQAPVTAVAPPPPATYQQAAAKLRKPEDWYAEIEELRAAGRVEEAGRELERLKKAHPGWLERHLEESKRR